MGDEVGSDISKSHFASVEGDVNLASFSLLAGSGDVDVPDISHGISTAGKPGLVESE